jgi:hypothetical protein
MVTRDPDVKWGKANFLRVRPHDGANVGCMVCCVSHEKTQGWGKTIQLDRAQQETKW